MLQKAFSYAILWPIWKLPEALMVSSKRDSVLRQLRDKKVYLTEHYGITRLGVFGSVARNEARENSDIDIVIEWEEPTLSRMVRLKEDLEKTQEKPVDVVRYRKDMNPYLKKRIDREAIYA
jgi:hypothetical protein